MSVQAKRAIVYEADPAAKDYGENRAKCTSSTKK